MTSIQNELKLAVDDFKQWVKSNHTHLQIEEGNVDDCGYPNWHNLEDLCERIFTESHFDNFSLSDKERIVFIIGRQWDLGRILNWFNKGDESIGGAGMTKEQLFELAKVAVTGNDTDAKGQLAGSLFKVGTKSEVTELLLKYYNDEDDWVRRQALSSLKDIGYEHLGELLINSWKYNEEHDRMTCLDMLFEIEHEHFETYLHEALTDDREYLNGFAVRMKERWDSQRESKFLEMNIFVGLTNMNDGFDVPTIHYFTESDFRIVLDRVKQFELGIYGIEPWKDGEFFDVYGHDDYSMKPTDPDWYFEAFNDFIATGEQLLYAATYMIPSLEKE